MAMRGWRRLTEVRAGAAKSVFHFDVRVRWPSPRNAGIPWLRFIRRRPRLAGHFWPFDGWDVPAGAIGGGRGLSLAVERGFPREDRNPHQHDAYSIAAWLRRADLDGDLAKIS